MNRLLRSTGPVLILILVLIGCASKAVDRSVVGGGEYNPHAQAPPHGAVYETDDGVKLIYDFNLEVYAVVGMPELYHHRDNYYRENEGRWELSTSLGGEWNDVEIGTLPVGLQLRDIDKGQPPRIQLAERDD